LHHPAGVRCGKLFSAVTVGGAGGVAVSLTRLIMLCRACSAVATIWRICGRSAVVAMPALGRVSGIGFGVVDW
jgi:hypothetical protein